MGLEEMKDKLSDMVGGLGDKGDEAVEKAEAVVDERTGEKFDAQTDQAADAAKDALSGSGEEAQ